MSDFTSHMIELLGEAPKAKDLHGADRERHLLGIYRRNLKCLLPPKWPGRSAYVRVLDRQKERPKYHLIYVTTHPRGIIEFMKISESLDQIQKRVRAATKQNDRINKSKQEELFSSDELVLADDDKVNINDVELYWLKNLSSQPKIFNREKIANMLEDTDWFPGDFQRALGNLISAKKVKNLDALGKRRKNFLHLNKGGERLQLMEDNK